MIKVLADKILSFDRGEIDRTSGQLITERTKIGFCELPDWVAKTDYFKAATADGSLKAFTAPGESEAVLKEQERLAAIKAEIAALEEQRDLLSGSAGIDPGTSDGTTSTDGTNPDSSETGKATKATK